MSFRTRSVTHGKSFLRAFSREKRYLTCVNFPFLSSPQSALDQARLAPEVTLACQGDERMMQVWFFDI